MDRKYALKLASCFIGLMLCAGFLSVNGQQAAPTDNKGFSAKPLSAVDLGPEIEGMKGRQLRMRMVTIEPGGVLGIHDHKDRPGTVYVLQGKFTVHLGNVVKEYGAGDTWSENKETTHWLENKGTTPAVLIGADILKLP
jgi:quercetin dioxygenase-like cupin family protein